jgi:hypothetical protein
MFAASATISLAAPSSTDAQGVVGIEAVSSKVTKDYVRVRLPDGSFQPEFYAFGKGGYWDGEIDDATIDKLTFLDVAHTIAKPLEDQKYIPATDPNKTKLLIMVYWGTTIVPPPYEEDPLYYNYEQALSEYRLLLAERQPGEADNVLSSGLHQLDIENHRRDQIDFRNAMMIGYDAGGLVGTDYGKYISHSALGWDRRDQMDEIEDNRYFVVLMAYDFQLLWKHKKHKLLWETRFSINEKHNQFDKALPAMVEYASKYFGQPSNGLKRNRLSEGHVEIGEPTVIEFLFGSKK